MCAQNIIIKQTESCAIFQSLSYCPAPNLVSHATYHDDVYQSSNHATTHLAIHTSSTTSLRTHAAQWLLAKFINLVLIVIWFEVNKLPAASRVFCWASKLRVATALKVQPQTVRTYFSVCWSIREFVLWSGSSEPVQEGTRHSGWLDWVVNAWHVCESFLIFGSAVIDLDLLKPFKLQLLVWICKYFAIYCPLSNYTLEALNPKVRSTGTNWVKLDLSLLIWVCCRSLQTPTVDLKLPTICNLPNFQSRLGSSKPKSEKYTVFNSSVVSTNLVILVCWSGYIEALRSPTLAVKLQTFCHCHKFPFKPRKFKACVRRTGLGLC